MDRRDFVHTIVNAAALLIAALLAAVLVIPQSSIQFTGLQNTKWYGDKVYGVNLNKWAYEIFELSSGTGEGRFLKIDQFDRKGIKAFPALEVADDGEVYLIRETGTGDGRSELSLERWNLQKNRLETVHKLPAEDCGQMVDFEISGGNFCFLFRPNTESDQNSESVYILTPSGSWIPASNTGMEDWDLGVTGVSLHSMPYPGVRLPFSTVLLRFLSAFAVLAAGWIIIRLAWQWWRTREYRPGLLVRLSLMLMAAFFVLIGIFYEGMRKYLYDYVSDNEIYAAMAEAELIHRLIDLDALDDLAEGRINSETEIFHEMLESGEGISAGVFWYEDGRLQELGDLFERGIYESSMTEGSLKDCVDEVLAQESSKGFLYAGRHGTHAMFMRLEKTASGLEAVLCTQIPMRQFQHDFHSILLRVLTVCEAVGLCILLVTILTLNLSLSPIRHLQHAISEVASGKLSTRARTNGHNELASTALELNLMLEELERTKEGADIYRKFYEAFWPMDLLRMISGKKFKASLKPGTRLVTDAAILALRAEEIMLLSQKERQDLLTAMFGLVRDRGGSVVHFEKGDFTAVFPERAADALSCAVLMQRKIEQKMGHIAHMGVSLTPVGLYVAESRDRRAVLVEGSNAAWKLSRLAWVFREGLILTASAAQAAMESGSEFHLRRLGKVAFENECPEEELYELLDAENAERRRKREMSRMRFEEGVEAYAAKDYYRARVAMISCLDADPEDRAARSYCMNCDRKEPPAVCQAEK